MFYQFIFTLQLVLVFSKKVENYPEIQVFMSPVDKPDHFIVPDKVVNGTTNYTLFNLGKPLSKIQKLTFTCIFFEPIEWFFEVSAIVLVAIHYSLILNLNSVQKIQ